MNITVLGAGNGGTTMAADLTEKGHTVTLLKTSKKGDLRHFSHLQDNNNKVEIIKPGSRATVSLDTVTYSFSEALTEETEVVVIMMPTTYQKEAIRRIAPFLRNGQIVILEPGYLSTAYLMEYTGHLDLTIVEAESSPLDCRIIAPGVVEVSFENVCNPIGVYPKSKGPAALERLESMGYNFLLRESVVESAFQNPNLIVHTVGGIMSIPRIEHSKGDYWMYKEVFSESVWNLVLSLDEEKIAVLKALGLPSVAYLDACKLRNSPSTTKETAKEVFDYYAQYDSVKGPTVSDSRYITEDVPEGLVLLESFGALLDIQTPVCSSLINLASACLAVDFREGGRTVESLGRSHIEKILDDTLADASSCLAPVESN